MPMVEERPGREFSLGQQQVLGPGCLVASCRSRPLSPLVLPVLLVAVCGSLKVSVVSCHSMLLWSSFALPSQSCSPIAPRNPSSIHAQVLLLRCLFGTGRGSCSLCRGCAVAQEASDHLHNPHKIKHLAVVLGFLLVLEQNQARCGSIPGCVTDLSPPRASVSLSALPFSCSASKG